MKLLRALGEFITDIVAVCGMLAVILFIAAAIVTGIVCYTDIQYNQRIVSEVCEK